MIVSGELTNKDETYNNVRSNKNIIKVEKTRQNRITNGGEPVTGTVDPLATIIDEGAEGWGGQNKERVPV